MLGDSGKLTFNTAGNLLRAEDNGNSGGDDTIKIAGGDNFIIGGVGSDTIKTGVDSSITRSVSATT